MNQFDNSQWKVDNKIIYFPTKSHRETIKQPEMYAKRSYLAVLEGSVFN